MNFFVYHIFACVPPCFSFYILKYANYFSSYLTHFNIYNIQYSF